MRNACAFIKALTENLLFRQAYDLVLVIFQEIVCIYLVPKLRVQRSFEENMEICELYFYGISHTGLNLSESVIEAFLSNLKYMMIQAYKSAGAKTNLCRYLDFLDLTCHFYRKSTENKHSIDRLMGIVETLRKSFNYPRSEESLKEKLQNAEQSRWNVTPEDFAKSVKLSATDTIHLNFEVNKNYKGIRNVGNSMLNFFC